jgi:NADPH:quinone reductase-like Zn-dependent oxidoreductase
VAVLHAEQFTRKNGSDEFVNQTAMKAAVQERYGPPANLRLAETDKPVVGDGDVLLQVRAAGVNPLDWHLVRGTPLVARIAFGISKPKVAIRGVDVAGRVEAVGKDVADIRAGDDVFGWCEGAFAQYASGPTGHFLPKPQTMTYEEAAAVPVAAVTALQALRDCGRLQAGQLVLINGAAGGVGTFAVQIAKALGAEVTGVCSSRNLDLVRSIGADHVVDYAREDFTKSGDRYDVILDNAGSQPISALRRTLVPGGTLVYNSGASIPRIAMVGLLSRTGRKVFTFLARLTHEDLAFISSLIESGKVRSVIDRTYPLEEVGAAIAYVEAGHARGKVVVTTAAPSSKTGLPPSARQAQ